MTAINNSLLTLILQGVPQGSGALKQVKTADRGTLAECLITNQWGVKESPKTPQENWWFKLW